MAQGLVDREAVRGVEDEEAVQEAYGLLRRRWKKACVRHLSLPRAHPGPRHK